MRDTHTTDPVPETRTHDTNQEQPAKDGLPWTKVLIPALITVLASVLTSSIATATTYKTTRSQQRQEIETRSKEQHAKAYDEYLTQAIQFRREVEQFLARQKKKRKEDCRVVHEQFHPSSHLHTHHIPLDIPDIDSRFKRLPGYPSYLHALNQVYVYGSSDGVEAAIKVDAKVIPPHQICTMVIIDDDPSTPAHRIRLRGKSGTTDDKLQGPVKGLRSVMCKEAPAKPRDNCFTARTPGFIQGDPPSGRGGGREGHRVHLGDPGMRLPIG